MKQIALFFLNDCDLLLSFSKRRLDLEGRLNSYITGGLRSICNIKHLSACKRKTVYTEVFKILGAS